MPNGDDHQLDLDAPVEVLNTGSPQDDDPRNATGGIALCLSGGGYRAMLFHLGSLWRLNEFGYLPKLTRISSVSGGSIIAGVLGLKWPRLAFAANGVATNFEAEVVPPIRAMAGKTIDDASILGGIFTPASIADRLAEAYRKHLFGGATLQDLPDAPEFVINAASVQTGALFRFLKAYMADYRVGRVRRPRVDLAVAVAASSAFPPVLSPLRLELDASAWSPPSGLASEDLHREPYLTDLVLTDGGVYDNLGLETAWKKFRTILVSNGGGKMQPEPEPKGDWARHAMRINEIIDNQVRSLRVRQVIGAFEAGERAGTYWSIRADIASYGTPQALPCPVEQTARLAGIRTRLKRLDATVQERLVNWGYAITDAAMRRWVDPELAAPRGFPYSAAGIG